MVNVPKQAIAAFCDRWSIVELALFGSVARGEERPDSDVDLMARFAPGEDWDLHDLGRMKVELETLFGRDVDLVEQGTIQNPYRRERIERDLTVLYAA